MKIIKILLLSFTFFILGCNEREKRFQKKWLYFRNQYVNFKEPNDSILFMAKDTFKTWIDLGLTAQSYYQDTIRHKWKILDYVFLNTTKTKCITYILKQHLDEKFVYDGTRTIIGEKYEGNWWFYPGPDYHMVRENKKIPTTINKLQKRARRIAMGWYYKEERKSFGDCNNFLLEFDFDGYNQCRKLNYTINDAAFERINWELERTHYPKFLKEKYVPDKKQDVI